MVLPTVGGSTYGTASSSAFPHFSTRQMQCVLMIEPVHFQMSLLLKSHSSGLSRHAGVCAGVMSHMLIIVQTKDIAFFIFFFEFFYSPSKPLHLLARLVEL